MSDLNLAINLSAVDAASTVIHGVGDAIAALASGNVMGAAVDIGKALLDVGASSVKMAGDFQASMIKSQAEAGLTKQQMVDMGNAILDMAPAVGQSPKALADGLFFVESAGFAGKNALDALRLSAQMAANDMSDTSTVAKGLTAAVKAFGYSTSQSAIVANQMTVTVSNGKMTMSDYANVIGKTAQIASQFHVSMSETNAALDTLTNNGFPSAAQAGTALQNVLQQFDGNTDKVTKNIHNLGLSFDENKFKSMDLQHQVEYLSEAMKGHEDQLQKVLGGSKSAALGYSALKNGAADYQSALEKLNDAQKNGGAEAQAFAATQQGLNFQMARFKEIGETAMIRLGQALLPMVTGAFELLNNTVQGVSTVINYVWSALTGIDFTDFNAACTDIAFSISIAVQAIQRFAASLKPLSDDVDPIADAIGTFAYYALQDLTNILWLAYEAIDKVAGAMLGVEGPADSIGNAFKQVGAILGGQFKADMAWINNAFDQTGNWIQTKLIPALATLIPPFQSIGTTILTTLLPAFVQVWASGQQLVEAVLTPLISVIGNIIPPVISLAGFLAGALAAGFKIVAPLVGILADVISGLVTFFTKTEIGGDLVKATLILLAVPVSLLAALFLALAVESIAAFIMSIPAMVTGFLAGAAAAWTMAAGVIAATWPFLAIIAVIALVILAIQHWSDIVNFLKMVWRHIADFFVNLWNGIVDHAKQAGASISSWWSGVWGSISDHSKQAGSSISSWWAGVVDNTKKGGAELSSWWSGVWADIVSALKDAWNFIVNAANTGAEMLNKAIVTAFEAIGAAFIWLYNHNYYIKALVDAIVSAFKACVAWIEMAWTASVNWLVGVWNITAKAATTAWNAVSNAVTGAAKVAWDWLVGAWTAVSKWLQDAWAAVAKTATTAWNAVSGAITAAAKVAWDWLVSAWTTASKWLQDAWATVAKFATDLWTKIATAVHDQWVKAVDYVTSVWNQISAVFTSAWNNYIVKPLTALWTNVSNVFSSAWNSYVSKPLSDLWNSISKWFADLGAGALRSGQNFINMLVNGINAGTGAIWNAVVNIANTIWKALGFHSPAQAGPGSDADKWMPNLVSMLSDGLNSNAAKVQSASNNIAAGINNALGKLGPNARVWSADMMNNFVNGILAAVNATGNAVAQIANKIAAFLHFSKPDTGALAASDTWMTDFGNMLTSGLTNNVNNVQKAAASLASAMSSALSNTGTNAMNSATNFINMLVNGINSGVGSIWNAVVNIANTIWRALGFHSPAKAGPGADADKWMPNLTSMLSSSLTAGVPKMQAAVDALTKPLAALSPTNSSLGTNVDKWTSDLISKISNDLTAGVSKIQAAVNSMVQPLASLGNGSAAPAAAAPQSTSNNTNATTIHVHLDGNSSADAQKRGKDIAEVVKKELAKGLRQQSIAPRYTSGGTHN